MNEKILVVDDDQSILRSISLVLQRDGYVVETAETAGGAFEKLKESRFDLVLVDIWLPDMKGTELLAMAKKELERTVKIIITGYPSAEAGAKARDLGADAFLIKPVNMRDLLSLIHMFLNEEAGAISESEEKLALSDVDSGVASEPGE